MLLHFYGAMPGSRSRPPPSLQSVAPADVARSGLLGRRLWAKILVGKEIALRHFDYNNAVIYRLMTRIARCGHGGIGGGAFCEILSLRRISQLLDWCGDDRLNHLGRLKLAVDSRHGARDTGKSSSEFVSLIR